MRIERERACDDLVLTAGERPSTYAECLLQIAGTMRADALTSVAAITMARKSQLEGRLLAILDPKRLRGGITRSVLIYSLAIVVVIALVVSALRIAGKANAGATIGKGPVQVVMWSLIVDDPLAQQLMKAQTETIQPSGWTYERFAIKNPMLLDVLRKASDARSILHVGEGAGWLDLEHSQSANNILNLKTTLPAIYTENGMQRGGNMIIQPFYTASRKFGGVKVAIHGQSTAELQHWGKNANADPGLARVSGEFNFDGIIKAGQSILFMSPMGKEMTYSPWHVIVMQALKADPEQISTDPECQNAQLWLDSGFAPRVETPANQSYVHTFSNGARAEIVALANRTQPDLLWSPDGKVLEKSFSDFPDRDGASWGADSFMRSVRIEVTEPQGDNTRTVDVLRRYSPGSAMGSSTSRENGHILIKEEFTNPFGTRTSSISIAIDQGEWQTLIASDSGADSFTFGENTYACKFGTPTDGDDGLELPVKRFFGATLDKTQVRLVAIDENGKTTPSTGHGATGHKARYFFRNLTTAQKLRFEFQVRNVEWHEFKDVRLFPDGTDQLKTAAAKANTKKPSITLFGITELSDDSEQWWKPDGSIHTEVPVKPDPQNSHTQGGGSDRFYEVVIELPKGISSSRGETPDKWDIPGAEKIGVGISGTTDDLSRQGRRFRMTTFAMRDPGNSVNVRYGIADGPWLTRARINWNAESTAEIKRSTVVISVPYQDGNEIKIDVKVPPRLVDAMGQRIIAVLKDGKTAKGGWMRHGGVTLLARKETYTFYDAKSEIDHFEYQTNDFRWTEFKNVALRPAIPSTVEFVALGYKLNDAQWWTPEGAVVTRPAALDQIPISTRDNHDVYTRQFCLRLPGRAEKRPRVILLDRDIRTTSYADKATGELWVRMGYADHRVGETPLNLAVGVCDGPWTTLLTRPAPEQSGKSTQMLSIQGKPVQFQVWNFGAPFFSASLKYPRNPSASSALAYDGWHDRNRAYRIVAVGKDGKVIEAREMSGTLEAGLYFINKDGSTGRSMNEVRSDEDHLQAEFDVPIDQIAEFRFEVSDYHWTEFNNVAAVPGVNRPPASTPASQPASMPATSPYNDHAKEHRGDISKAALIFVSDLGGDRIHLSESKREGVLKKWQIESYKPFHLAYGCLILDPQGRYVGWWGTGMAKEAPMETQPQELSIAFAPSDDKKELLVIMNARHQREDGSVNSSHLKRLPIPKGADFNTRVVPGLPIRGPQFHALWEGRFMVKGKVVQRIIFCVRASNDASVGLDGGFGDGKEEQNLKDMVNQLPEYGLTDFLSEEE